MESKDYTCARSDSRVRTNTARGYGPAAGESVKGRDNQRAGPVRGTRSQRTPRRRSSVKTTDSNLPSARFWKLGV